MNITIVGAGNTAIAAACHMQSKGVPVMVYARNEEKARLWKTIPVQAEGVLKGAFSLSVSSDPAEALGFGDILIVATLATNHEQAARDIAPFLRKGQSLFFFNGCWGALQACRVLKDHRKELDLTIGETANMPYIAALAPDWRSVKVKGIKESVAFSAVGNRAGMVEACLKKMYGSVQRESSLAATSLGSTNPIIHVTASLFNITRIENREDFFFFGAPMTKRVVAFMEKADAERLRVGQALGLTLPSLLEGLNSFWPDKWGTLYEALHNNKSYSVSKGPVSLDYRYLSEDLPCGIGAVRDLGHLLGISVPYTEALAAAASLYLGQEVKPFLSEEDLQLLQELK